MSQLGPWSVPPRKIKKVTWPSQVPASPCPAGPGAARRSAARRRLEQAHAIAFGVAETRVETDPRNLSGLGEDLPTRGFDVGNRLRDVVDGYDDRRRM